MRTAFKNRLDGRTELELRRYPHVLRPALAFRRQRLGLGDGVLPPTDIMELAKEADTPAFVNTFLCEIVEKRRDGRGHDLIQRNATIDDFWGNEMQEAYALSKTIVDARDLNAVRADGTALVHRAFDVSSEPAFTAACANL